MAQVGYTSNAGVQSRKGFYYYKSFINKMKSNRHMEERNITQVTVWDKIKRLEKRKRDN